jgi:hypothetical protein
LACDSEDVTAPPPPPASPEELLESFRDVYVARDYAGFAALFPQDGLGVDYAFILNEPDPMTNDRDWDVTTELALHRRMFDPAHPLLGEHQVPSDYWPQNIRMTLTLVKPVQELTDLALPSPWRVWDCELRAQVVWDLAGPTDYSIDGRARFIVIEDRTLPASSHGKFLIYRWEDLGVFKASRSLRVGVESTSWSQVKTLFN